MSQLIPPANFEPGTPAGSLLAAPPAAPRGTSTPKRRVPRAASTPGFVLLDTCWNPIAFNPEAVQILSYPDKPPDPKNVEAFLAKRIRSKLVGRSSGAGTASFVTVLRSGRRQYFCHAFDVASTAKAAFGPAVALVLERNSAELKSMSEVAAQFKLTPREREAVELLLNGLTSKEIAGRMNVSSNTVKAFLRLVMIKMGASTRSGIVGKIITSKDRDTWREKPFLPNGSEGPGKGSSELHKTVPAAEVGGNKP